MTCSNLLDTHTYSRTVFHMCILIATKKLLRSTYQSSELWRDRVPGIFSLINALHYVDIYVQHTAVFFHEHRLFIRKYYFSVFLCCLYFCDRQYLCVSNNEYKEPHRLYTLKASYFEWITNLHLHILLRLKTFCKKCLYRLEKTLIYYLRIFGGLSLCYLRIYFTTHPTNIPWHYVLKYSNFIRNSTRFFVSSVRVT